jgi:hypothetical protein
MWELSSLLFIADAQWVFIFKLPEAVLTPQLQDSSKVTRVICIKKMRKSTGEQQMSWCSRVSFSGSLIGVDALDDTVILDVRFRNQLSWACLPPLTQAHISLIDIEWKFIIALCSTWQQMCCADSPGSGTALLNSPRDLPNQFGATRWRNQVESFQPIVLAEGHYCFAKP